MPTYTAYLLLLISWNLLGLQTSLHTSSFAHGSLIDNDETVHKYFRNIRLYLASYPSHLAFHQMCNTESLKSKRNELHHLIYINTNFKYIIHYNVHAHTFFAITQLTFWSLNCCVIYYYDIVKNIHACMYIPLWRCNDASREFDDQSLESSNSTSLCLLNSSLNNFLWLIVELRREKSLIIMYVYAAKVQCHTVRFVSEASFPGPFPWQCWKAGMEMDWGTRIVDLSFQHVKIHMMCTMNILSASHCNTNIHSDIFSLLYFHIIWNSNCSPADIWISYAAKVTSMHSIIKYACSA